MVGNFTEKVAFISGATGALGKTQRVETFCAKGAKIAATYLVEREVEVFPRTLKEDRKKILFMKADLTREADVRTAFQTLMETYGRLDYLLNLVGGYMVKTPIAELDVQQWDRMMEVNLKSVFLCSRSALEIMSKNGSGRIINISAMAGLGAYAISKAGVVILTQILAD